MCNKDKKGENMKKTTKILAVVLCVSILLALLVGCSSIDGTYYLLENGVKNPEVWIKIDGDEWEDSNELYGIVTQDGDQVVLSLDIFGTNLDIVTGTMDGDTFTCDFIGDALVYQK